MAGKRELKVEILGDAGRLSRTLDDVADKSDGFGRRVAAIGGVIAGAFAVDRVIDFGRASLEAATESAKVVAQTDAAIRSTGGAAQVSVDHVGELASRLQGLSGVEDEVVQAGSNMLLTFTNVRNEVGAGNDVFDQATATALDMSVALGQDTASSAMQLGKAINDPIKGVTALQRVGVTFTDSQKDQIRVLQESGDIMGAQKIILGELNKEFGGSAAAAGAAMGPAERLSLAWGDLQEEVGTRLLPVLSGLATAFAEHLPRAMQVIGPIVDTVGSAIGRAAEVVKEFWYSLTTGFSVDEGTPVELLAIRIRDVVLPVLDTLGRVFVDDVLPAFGAVVDFVRDHATPILYALGAALGAAGLVAIVTTVVGAIGALVAALASPVVLIAALVAAVVYAYTEFEGFRAVVDVVAQWLIATAWPAIQSFAALVADGFSALVGWVRDHWTQIQAVVNDVVTIVRAVIEGFIGAVQLAWRLFGDELLAVARAAWDYVRSTVENAVNAVRSVIQLVVAVIQGDWGRAWDAIKGLLSAVWAQMGAIVTLAVEVLRAAVSAGLSAIGALWGLAWDAIKAAAGRAWDGIKAAVAAAIDGAGGLVEWFTALPGKLVAALGDLVETLVQKGQDMLAGMIQGLVIGSFSLASWIGSIPSKVIGWIGDLAQSLVQKGKDLIAGFISGITQGAAAIPGAIGSAVNSAVSAVNPFGDGPGIERAGGGRALSAPGGSVRIADDFGPGGTARQIVDIAQGAGVAITAGSIYRPGAITATGNPSYHGQNRAVDFSGNMQQMWGLFRHFQAIGGRLKELIFSPAGGDQVRNGAGHMYSGITRDMHWDHVHVAMAEGGTLRRASRVLVGEYEPEILDLPTGARVTPLSAAAVGGDHWDVTYAPVITLGSAGVGADVIDLLERMLERDRVEFLRTLRQSQRAAGRAA